MDIDPEYLMKSLKKMQENFGNLGSTIEHINVTGAAGAGLVEVDMNGKMQVEDVRLAKEVVNPDDVSLLQDLLVCAFNDATSKLMENIRSQTGNLASIVGALGGS